MARVDVSLLIKTRGILFSSSRSIRTQATATSVSGELFSTLYGDCSFGASSVTDAALKRFIHLLLCVSSNSTRGCMSKCELSISPVPTAFQCSMTSPHPFPTVYSCAYSSLTAGTEHGSSQHRRNHPSAFCQIKSVHSSCKSRPSLAPLMIEAPFTVETFWIRIQHGLCVGECCSFLVCSLDVLNSFFRHLVHPSNELFHP